VTTQVEDAFWDGAERRIERILRVLIAALLVLFWLWRGTGFALGFAAGSLLAYVNLTWLKRTVSRFVDAAVGASEGKPRPSGIAGQTVLRLGLLLLGVYVIFNSSALDVMGFLVGLFMPLAAFFCEAAYEAYKAARHEV
jgi:hypothetical protein